MRIPEDYRFTCFALISLALFVLAVKFIPSVKEAPLLVRLPVGIGVVSIIFALVAFSALSLVELAHCPFWFIKYPIIGLFLYLAIRWLFFTHFRFLWTVFGGDKF